jgi:hypothetical protein
MAPLPPVPGVVKCQVLGSLTGIPIATVFHLGYTGSGLTGLQCEEIAQIMEGSWAAHLQPQFCTNATWDTWIATDLISDTGSQGILEAASTGALTGPPVPNNVQLVISKAIARRYRGGRPRTYLPALPASELISQTHWADAFAVTMANAWAAFINQIVHDVSLPFLTSEVCVHYVKNDLPLPAPLVDATQGAVGRTLIGTLRRRLT